jgi:hypothetical protein
MSSWPSWEEWIAALDADTRSRAESLRDVFAAAGADEPESWARSEVSEDIAQLTRFLFLRAVWRRMESVVQDAMSSTHASSLIAAGADAGSLDSLVKSAIYDLAFNLCYLIDEPDGTTWMEGGVRRSDVAERDRRWELREITPDASLTGRDVGGLHESLLETDPSGREGEGWLSFDFS